MFCLAVLVGGGHLWDVIAGPLAEGGQGPFATATTQIKTSLAAIEHGVLHLSPGDLRTGLVGLVWGTPSMLWHAGACWFVTVWGLFALVVLALSLGVQSRYEATLVAQRHAPSFDRLLDESALLAPSFVAAWCTPVAIAAGLGLAIMVGSFVLLNVPVVNILGAIVWGVALAGALGLAVLLLAMATCGALLVPAVAVDGSAGPDAMHRAFATATSRPLRWIGGIVVIVIGLGAGLVLMNVVTSLAAWLATGLGGMWVFNDAFAVQAGAATDASWITTRTAEVLGFWLGLLEWVVAAWVLCYLAAATTRSWMLLRSAVDGTAIEDIWRPGLMRGTLAPVDEA